MRSCRQPAVVLSLCGACQVDVAVSTSSCHADLSIARRLAVARPKLSGRRSSSTVLSQVCLGLPTLRRQSFGGPKMQAWRAREWSWLVSAWLRWPKKDRRRLRIVSDRNGCPVRDLTSSLETKSVQWIWRVHLRHQLSNASILPSCCAGCRHNNNSMDSVGSVNSSCMRVVVMTAMCGCRKENIKIIISQTLSNY